MKRRKFLKSLGVGSVAAVVVPSLLVGEENSTNPHKILKKTFDVPKSDLVEKNYISSYGWYNLDQRNKEVTFNNKIEKDFIWGTNKTF